MAERVLVTGASGFIGRALLAPLAACGFEVHALARHEPGPGLLPAVPVTWHRADLLDVATARRLVQDVRPAVLVHAAWYVAHGRFWTAAANGHWLEASTRLAEAFAGAGGRRFIGLGSCAEYAVAAAGDGLPWPEHRPIAPATPYGLAKAALADRLTAMATRHPGLTVGWARLFHLFGPGEHPERLVPSVALALLEGREAACASGQPVRDFASTWFIGKALAALAESRVTGPINIASGQPVAIRDLVLRLGRLTERAELIRFGRLPDRPGEAPFVVADTTRLTREVGFTERAELGDDLAACLDQLAGRSPGAPSGQTRASAG